MPELVRVGDVLTQVKLPISLHEDKKYTSIGIKSFGKGIFHYEPKSLEKLSKLRYFQVPTNALALSNIKAWEGAIALTGDLNQATIASNRFLFYQPHDNRADIRYFLYYFLTKYGLSLIGKASPGSADRNRTLGIKAFENLFVPLPNIDEQRRIADKLDALLSRVYAVQELRARSASLQESLAESLIEKATTSTDKAARVGEVVTLERSPISIEPEGSYRVIGAKSFGKGIIRYPPALGSDVSKLNYFKLPSGALLLSNIKAWEGAISVTTETEARDYIASNRFLSYTPRDERVNTSYLRHYFLCRHGLSQVSAASPGGADRNRTLGRSRFEALTIPLPPRAEQDRIARILDSLNDRIRRAHADPALDSLRPSILNAAFTGQL